MDNKKLFEAALSAKMSDYPFSDTKTVMNNIMERAEKMKNHENAKQMKFTEITPEYIEPKKSHKAISVVAGIAGAAAVLTGAVFGLNWLNEHGGLKERGSDEIRAGYSQNIYYAETPSASDPIDISDLSGKTLQFSDFTAKITSASYDGSYMRVDYEGTCEISLNRNTLLFEPQSSGYSNGLYENMAIFSRGNGIDDNTEKYTIIKSFVLASDESMELVPAYYPDRRPIERINDITVSLKNENRRLIEQYIESEDMEISDGLDLPMLHISPNMLEIDPKTDEYALLNEKPVVTALRKDGTQVELLGVTVSTSPSYFGADHYGYSGQYFYITPDPDDGDLTEMKAFIVNGKMYEVTAEPVPAATTTILENGEIAEYVITSTTAAENGPVESETDTTKSCSGYYEGEAALSILKQYAGEDYCFPFDKLEKEKVSYYDGDKWTNSDEIKFNFAVGEEGVPIKAITSGTVIETFSRNVPGYGEGIYITIQATDGRKWRYRHLSDFYVTEGDTVRAGDVIAAVGATGWCTGPCLTISFPEDEAEPTALEGGIVGTATTID